MTRLGRIAAVLLTGSLAATAAHAQRLLPPDDIPGGGVERAQTQDPAGLLVRIDRLEGQLRTATGQIEDMQFQIKRLEDQLRKFQQDVDFRFQESSGKGAAPRAPASTPGRRSERSGDDDYAAAGPGDGDSRGEGATGSVAEASPPVVGGLRGRRNDAFDPDAAPHAPGAPMQLGATPSPSAPRVATRAPPLTSGPLDDGSDLGIDADPNAPMDLMRRGAPRAPGPVGLNAPPAAGRDNSAPTPVSLPPATPRDEFDQALGSLRAGQYDAAGEAFQTFLRKHPKDRLDADATFYLGESFFRRARPREAAEQYLKVSTDFERSARAPEALVKLGLSLEKLGAHEQACAAYGEVGRKYPSANATVRAGADRESKRAQC